jgi:hypothetical protein
MQGLHLRGPFHPKPVDVGVMHHEDRIDGGHVFLHETLEVVVDLVVSEAFEDAELAHDIMIRSHGAAEVQKAADRKRAIHDLMRDAERGQWRKGITGQVVATRLVAIGKETVGLDGVQERPSCGIALSWA